MNVGDKYVKLIEWSDEDECFTGSCPELFYGGCHGDDAKAVFAKLCRLVESAVKTYQAENKTLPKPMTGKDFVNTMQRIA